MLTGNRTIDKPYQSALSYNLTYECIKQIMNVLNWFPTTNSILMYDYFEAYKMNQIGNIAD